MSFLARVSLEPVESAATTRQRKRLAQAGRFEGLLVREEAAAFDDLVGGKPPQGRSGLGELGRALAPSSSRCPAQAA